MSKVIENESVELITAEEASGHEAVSGEANSSVLASLGIQGGILVSQFINFILVIGIVWFLILKPLTKKLEERKKLIDDSIDGAKKIESDLKMTELKAQEMIDNAKVEANRIIEASSREATEAGNNIRKKVKEEIDLLVTQAKKNIEVDKEQMRKEIQEDSVGLVVEALEKVLGSKMDSKKDEEFIRTIVSSVKSSK